MRLALYQPDIPQNVGSILRLSACFSVPVDLIPPFGFPWDDRRVRRAAMDYIDAVDMTHHRDWDSYRAQMSGRLILASTHAAEPINRFQFLPTDTILMGRESAGVPPSVAESCDGAVRIPMRTDLRSINVSQAAAIVLFEALRQVDSLID